MTEAIAKGQVPRETRYPIQGHRPLEVEIQRETDEATETTRGQLVELSAGGAKISVESSFAFDEDLRLRIESDELDLSIVAKAKVHWSRPDQGSKWMIGCSVTPRITEDVLTLLAVAGYVNRRHATRTSMSVRTAVQWELQARKCPAWLRDYGSRGFAMVCPHHPNVGDRLLLYLTDSDGSEVSMPAQVLWRSKQTTGCAVGCSLLNSDDVRHLARAANESKQTQHSQQPAAQRQSPWLFAGLTAIAFLGPPVVYTTIRTLSQSSTEVTANVTPPDDDAEQAEPTKTAGQAQLAEAPDVEHSTNNVSDTAPRQPSPQGLTGAAGIEPSSGVDLPETRLESVTGPRPDEPSKVASPPMSPPSQTVSTVLGDAAGADKAELLLTGDGNETAETLPEVTPPPPSLPAMPVIRDAPTAAKSRTLEPIVDSKRRPSDAPHPPTAATVSPPVTVTSRETGNESLAPIAPPAPPRVAVRRRSSVPAARLPIDDIVPATLTVIPRRAAVTPAMPTDDEVRRAADAFQRGSSLYHRGQLQPAAGALLAACEDDDGNPLYVYVLAMIQYRMNQPEDARGSVEKASALEQDRPIENWGRVMQRYQGQTRVWLERSRAGARARLGG